MTGRLCFSAHLHLSSDLEKEGKVGDNKKYNPKKAAPKRERGKREFFFYISPLFPTAITACVNGVTQPISLYYCKQRTSAVTICQKKSSISLRVVCFNFDDFSFSSFHERRAFIMWETAITANYSSGREEDPTTPKYPIPPFQKRSSGSGSWFFFSSNEGDIFRPGKPGED